MIRSVGSKTNTWISDAAAAGTKTAIPVLGLGLSAAIAHSYLNQTNMDNDVFHAAVLLGAASFTVGALSSIKDKSPTIQKNTDPFVKLLKEMHFFGKKGAVAGTAWGIGEQASSEFFAKDTNSWLFGSTTAPTLNERLSTVGTSALIGYSLGSVAGAFLYFAGKAGIKVKLIHNWNELREKFYSSQTAKKLRPLLNLLSHAHNVGQKTAVIGAMWEAGLQLSSNPPSMNPSAWSWQGIKDSSQNEQIAAIGARLMTSYLTGCVIGTIDHIASEVF